MSGVTFSYRAKVVTICVIIALALLFLFTVRHMLAPFVWAMIVAYVFNPLVSAFSRKTRLHRFWGVALLYAVLAGIVVWAAVFVVPSLRHESQQFGRDLPGLIQSLYVYLLGQDKIDIFGLRLDPQTFTRDLFGSVQKFGSSATVYVVPFFFGVLGWVTKVLLFLFSLFYFLLEADEIGNFLRRLLPVQIKDEILGVAAEIDDVLGRWVRGQLTLVIIMTSVTWVALSVLGVRYALVLAIITGVLEIFPIVGPVIAGAIACIVALFEVNPFGWSNLTYVAVIVAVYFVLRHAEDYFVIPHIIGRIVEFHPLAVLFAVFAGGSIAGVLGMFIAAPTLAVVKITMRYLYGKIVEQPMPAEALERQGASASPNAIKQPSEELGPLREADGL